MVTLKQVRCNIKTCSSNQQVNLIFKKEIKSMRATLGSYGQKIWNFTIWEKHQEVGSNKCCLMHGNIY